MTLIFNPHFDMTLIIYATICYSKLMSKCELKLMLTLNQTASFYSKVIPFAGQIDLPCKMIYILWFFMTLAHKWHEFVVYHHFYHMFTRYYQVMLPGKFFAKKNRGGGQVWEKIFGSLSNKKCMSPKSHQFHWMM